VQVDETVQQQLEAVEAGGVKFYWLGARHGAVARSWSALTASARTVFTRSGREHDGVKSARNGHERR
jgi:hypothetical protein